MAMMYSPRAAWFVGILLVILGFVSFITGIIGLGACHGQCAPLVALTGAPIWSGVVVIIAGVFAVWSARRPENGCLITTFLTFALLAALLTLICWLIALIEIGEWNPPYVTVRRPAAAGNDADEFPTPASVPGTANVLAGTGAGAAAGAAVQTTAGPTEEPEIYWPYYDDHWALWGVIFIFAVIEFVLSLIAAIISCLGLCTGYHGHEAPAIVVYDGTKAVALKPGQRAVQQPDGSIKIVATDKDKTPKDATPTPDVPKETAETISETAPPESKPEPEPEAKPEPEAEAEAKPDEPEPAAASTPESEATTEPASEPEVAAAAEPEPETAAEPEPEAAAEPEPASV
ncbi:uncharacterized protein [Branchiostoma lanceolatum]|uniref:uncharacterized protein isoform X1 n=1 Tax=Branchiostoma lanceolatum TaxID=7740 RepID=UPI0034551286